jgi:3'-phosphoadenosine 5'-phosphosulfate sulfotransferase
MEASTARMLMAETRSVSTTAVENIFKSYADTIRMRCHWHKSYLTIPVPSTLEGMTNASQRDIALKIGRRFKRSGYKVQCTPDYTELLIEW